MKNKTDYTNTELNILSNYISEKFNVNISINVISDLYTITVHFKIVKIYIYFRFNDMPVNELAKIVSDLILKEYYKAKMQKFLLHFN